MVFIVLIEDTVNIKKSASDNLFDYWYEKSGINSNTRAYSR